MRVTVFHLVQVSLQILPQFILQSVLSNPANLILGTYNTLFGLFSMYWDWTIDYIYHDDKISIIYNIYGYKLCKSYNANLLPKIHQAISNQKLLQKKLKNSAHKSLKEQKYCLFKKFFSIC